MLAGSYVALTVLGRPPGLTQIPLSEAESEMLGVSISSPNSPATERPYSPQDRFSSQPSWVLHTSQLLVPYIYSIVQCVFFLIGNNFHSSFTLHVCICVLRIGSFPPLYFSSLCLITGWEQQCLQPEGWLLGKNALQRAAGPAGS